MANLIPQPWTFYGGLWHQKPEGGSPTAPNSGAILSGGSTLRGPYDFSSNTAPVDPNYFAWTNAGGTLDYSNGYVRGTYPEGVDEASCGIDIALPAEAQEIYVEFKARMNGAVHGLKFCKLFGQTGSNGYANCTFGLDYTGIDNGGMLVWSFGDGASAGNQDTTHIISLNESLSTTSIGRNTGTAVIAAENGEFASSDWGSDWHTFRLYFKHSTGLTSETEVADGAVYIEIDGVVMLDAGTLFTRHFNNGQFIESVQPFGWTQGSAPNFHIDYDDIVISQGGFVV